jgi:phage baseplate assembly protein gpV
MNRGGAIAAVVREVDASQGRVRVEYVQIEMGLESPWAYVATPLAGSNRGMLFMPEVGDEVLVVHGNNDFDHPYVIGYLWNGQQRSPETEPEMRVIKTPGGHQLRFEDKNGTKKVILKSDGNRSLTLDDQPGLGRIEVKSGGNEILMDDNPAGTLIKLQAGTAVGVAIMMNATPVPSLAISVGGTTTVTIDASGVSVTTASLANITCTSAILTAAAALTINAPALSVNSGFVNVAGVLQCATLVTNAVVSPLYTPGLGNLL